MEELFQEIARQEKCDFLLNEQTFKDFDRREYSVFKYKLNFQYKNYTIWIKNELGGGNLGRIEVVLNPGKLIPNFIIMNRNHLWRLFNKNSNILKVECENDLFKSLLQNIILINDLENIARANLFEPKIYNQRIDNHTLL